MWGQGKTQDGPRFQLRRDSIKGFSGRYLERRVAVVVMVSDFGKNIIDLNKEIGLTSHPKPEGGSWNKRETNKICDTRFSFG